MSIQTVIEDRNLQMRLHHAACLLDQPEFSKTEHDKYCDMIGLAEFELC